MLRIQLSGASPGVYRKCRSQIARERQFSALALRRCGYLLSGLPVPARRTPFFRSRDRQGAGNAPRSLTVAAPKVAPATGCKPRAWKGLENGFRLDLNPLLLADAVRLQLHFEVEVAGRAG